MKKEELSEYAKVQGAGRRIKESSRQSEGPKGVDLGLCSKCCHLMYLQRRYGAYTARCQIFDSPIHEEDPPTKCTSHYPKGQLSLVEMYALAIPIEEKSKRQKAGFDLSGDDDARMEIEYGYDLSEE